MEKVFKFGKTKIMCLVNNRKVQIPLMIHSYALSQNNSSTIMPPELTASGSNARLY